MDVSTAVDLLAQAELKQLSLKDDKETVLGFINFGILEIHKRFDLWNAEAIVTMKTGVSLYKLDGTDSNVVIDLSDKEFLTIEEVWNYNGDQLVMNNTDDLLGVNTPKYNQLEVGQIINGAHLSVIYRAAPPFLCHEKEIIPLPPQYFEALFHYVGYRGHGSVKGDVKTENNTHYLRFERSCDRIKFEGLGVKDDLQSQKFEPRGFV